MSTANDFTVFRKIAGDKIAELIDRAEKAERELAATQHLLHESLQREDRFYRELAAAKAEIALAAAKDAEADTARLDWLLQDAELNLFFVDRDEIDAAMKEASK